MLALALALLLGQVAPQEQLNRLWLPETPNRCASCAGWNRPHRPIHVFGNTWWVGVEGLSVVAVDTGRGLILLDGALPQSVPLIKASIAAAGLDFAQVKLIGNSHAHFDHAGGIAALQTATGATVLASPRSAEVLRWGCPTSDDPQAGFGCATNGLPRVAGPIRVLRDGETLKLGNVVLEAHFTPGHTPGSTTWSWKSCEGSRCLDIVYADSLNPVSADGFKFQSIAASFEASIVRLGAMPCDVLLSAHPDASNTIERLSAASSARTVDPAQPGQCAEYADRAQKKLRARLDSESRARSLPGLGSGSFNATHDGR